MEQACLGVVAAMPQEIAPLLKRLKGYQKGTAAGFTLYRFEVEGRQVALIESGMGPRHAAAATKALIEHARPAVILNYGFCGAVLPGSAVGDLVLAHKALLLEDGELTEVPHLDDRLTARVMEACQVASFTVHRGSFVTAPTIMNKEAVAEALHAGADCPVLEMETGAVLLEAALAGIPAVALRGVSDAADEELGFSIDEFCDAQLKISLLRVLKCVALRPWIIPQLLRLSGNTKKAGNVLAGGVALALSTLARA